MTKRTLILDAELLIKNANDNIEKNIDVLCPENTGLCAQNILSQLRNLLDAFALLHFRLDNKDDPEMNGRERIKHAKSYLCSDNKRFSPFKKTYKYIESAASHYTPDQFGSFGILLKYANLLQKLKESAKREFNKDILNNIDEFPLKMSDQLKDYYLAVFEKLKKSREGDGKGSTFYVEGKRRIYVSNSCYMFEYVLSPATDKRTKFDRLTAFSLADIGTTHSVRCKISTTDLLVSDIKTSISIIDEYSISIRPCELKVYAFLEGFDGFPKNLKRGSAGYEPLMWFLTERSLTLYDLINLEDEDFQQALDFIRGANDANSIIDFLVFTRQALNKREVGFKTLTYLLFVFRHDIMKKQKCWDPLEDRLGKTGLSYRKCNLFETLPFSFSLKGHNPKTEDLLECLSDFSSPDQLLNKRIISNTETSKKLFTPIEELNEHYLTEECIEEFNLRLPFGFERSSLQLTPDKSFVYSKQYADDTKAIISYLKRKALSGCEEYGILAERYLSENTNLDIDDCKKDLLRNAFRESHVVLINGAAGTGKTTTIRHLSNILESEKVLFLSYTNSSVQNLLHKVGVSGIRKKSDFKTVESFLSQRCFGSHDYKTVVIDECSTLSNADFKRIIDKCDFEKLILVGDEEQIESIRFGNWFGISKYELRNYSFELSFNHRTNDPNIETIWKEVRDYDENLPSHLSLSGFVSTFNNTIFEKDMDDEVVLCLNYDGFYGINNINRHMQEKNQGNGVSWGVWSFKEGDKIIFNDSSYFKDYFYNNQKGTIMSIQESENQVVFTVSVKKEEGNNYASNDHIEFVAAENDCDYYKITIDKNDDNDDEETNKVLVVPFQLGYALSIHKAQGLEFDSVKIILTKESEEHISHNIFYTAITRSKKKLKIYCDDKALAKILGEYRRTDYARDSGLLKMI